MGFGDRKVENDYLDNKWRAYITHDIHELYDKQNRFADIVFEI